MHIKDYYIPERVKKVDPDFLDFEETMIRQEDSSKILELLTSQTQVKIPNRYNSILLYITGLSDEFDFKKARSYTVGGSEPD